MTYEVCRFSSRERAFQYRKRYEVTCDYTVICLAKHSETSFNTASGMRSHVTEVMRREIKVESSFNTASGMRSHVTSIVKEEADMKVLFQYRKRYEVTCDLGEYHELNSNKLVSIPQAV